MAKNATIIKNRYNKTHMKQYLLKYHLVNDADIIEKLDSVPSKQGYVRNLIREDIDRNSVPVSFSDTVLGILEEKSKETGIPVPEIIAAIVSESAMRTIRI